MKTNTAVTTLTALAQETRLRIYRELVKAYVPEQDRPGDDAAGTPVGDLVNKLNVSPPTLSFHLKELSNARLITSKRAGRSILYSANLDTMQALIDHLLEDCCSGACGVMVEK